MDADSDVSVMTGAGVTAASGIPTFRGDDGLWEEYDPSDLASPEAFRNDPETVWKWYDERRRIISEAEPNPGHQSLAEWESIFDRFSLITQNVDGLHEAAGSSRVIHLHGNIWEVSCWDRCDESGEPWEHREVPIKPIPPHCPHCEGLLRPNVVWFGESLNPGTLDAAQRAVDCDVFFTIGTSAEVHPAAGFIDRASRQGAFTVEINPNTTSASRTVNLSVQAPAEQVLPTLTQSFRSC